VTQEPSALERIPPVPASHSPGAESVPPDAAERLPGPGIDKYVDELYFIAESLGDRADGIKARAPSGLMNASRRSRLR
jgi:hypothetical protein